MGQFSLNVENPGAQELRKFGIVTGLIVAVLFGLLLLWIFDFNWPKWPWVISGILWVWALIAPATLFVVYKYWLKFGHVAGWINTRIILGIRLLLLNHGQSLHRF